MSSFSHGPISKALGVAIDGLDLRRKLAADTREGLKTLLDQHHLLVFRNQDIEAEDQIRLLGMFGPICDEVGNGSFHSFVSNVRKDGLFGEWELVFHSDWTWRAYQPPVFSLYGLEVNGASVPTRFANGIRACQVLSPELRQKLASMSAVHASDLTTDSSVGYGPRVRLLDFPVMPPEQTHPRAVHPVLKPHPKTGTPVLFVTHRHTSHFQGLTSEENEQLMAQVFEVLYHPDNVYTHHWSKGDLVVWDNVALQHGRQAVALGEEQKRRTLRRVVVSEKSVKEMMAGVGTRPTAGGFTSARNDATRNSTGLRVVSLD